MADEGFFENLSQADLGGLLGNVREGLRDEWLGVDDFGRFLKYAQEGEFRKALKSLGAGALELGGTALMFVPGGQIASLAAKGGKVGALGKGLKFLKPLTLEEQSLIKAGRAAGARPGLLRGVEVPLGALPPSPEVAAKGFRKALEKFKPQIVGGGPGGYAGSLARGLGQATGMLPAEQGLLAKRALAQRTAGEAVSRPARLGEMVSGKLGSAATRTGIDTELTKGLLGSPAPATAMPTSIVDLYLSDAILGTNYIPQITSMSDAILAQVLGGVSPLAAM